MDIINILIPVTSMGLLGLALGAGLGVAGKKFAVETDEREEKIYEALPGANCGGCGYPGCSGLANAIVKGDAKTNACPVGGSETAKKIANILGVKAEEVKRMASYVKCNGTCENTKTKYEYDGMKDCRAVTAISGSGQKECRYGCVGLGTCIKVCKFGALSVVNGVAVVDSEKCTACKACINICPKKLIELVPLQSKVKVKCNSKDKAKDTKNNCSAGCIGCKRCEKVCKSNAIHVVENLAVIDYTKCIGCKSCADVCISNVIIPMSDTVSNI